MVTQGVEYESHNIEIKPALKALYNEACDVWYEVSQNHKTITFFVMPASIRRKGWWGGALCSCAMDQCGYCLSVD